MKLIEITRTISGEKWDNISLKAELVEGEDPIEVAIKLDKTLQDALYAITNREVMAIKAKSEKNDTVSLLETALDYAQRHQLPF